MASPLSPSADGLLPPWSSAPTWRWIVAQGASPGYRGCHLPEAPTGRHSLLLGRGGRLLLRRRLLLQLGNQLLEVIAIAERVEVAVLLRVLGIIKPRSHRHPQQLQRPVGISLP